MPAIKGLRRDTASELSLKGVDDSSSLRCPDLDALHSYKMGWVVQVKVAGSIVAARCLTSTGVVPGTDIPKPEILILDQKTFDELKGGKAKALTHATVSSDLDNDRQLLIDRPRNRIFIPAPVSKGKLLESGVPLTREQGYEIGSKIVDALAIYAHGVPYEAFRSRAIYEERAIEGRNKLTVADIFMKFAHEEGVISALEQIPAFIDHVKAGLPDGISEQEGVGIVNELYQEIQDGLMGMMDDRQFELLCDDLTRDVDELVTQNPALKRTPSRYDRKDPNDRAKEARHVFEHTTPLDQCRAIEKISSSKRLLDELSFASPVRDLATDVHPTTTKLVNKASWTTEIKNPGKAMQYLQARREYFADMPELGGSAYITERWHSTTHLPSDARDVDIPSFRVEARVGPGKYFQLVDIQGIRELEDPAALEALGLRIDNRGRIWMPTDESLHYRMPEYSSLSYEARQFIRNNTPDSSLYGYRAQRAIADLVRDDLYRQMHLEYVPRGLMLD